MKKSTLTFFLLIVGLLCLNTYIIANKKTSSPGVASLLTCDQLLEHASRLSAKKIYAPAAEGFGKYIDSCNLKSKDAAITYLRVADLYYDSKNFGQALSAYYLAETLDKELKKFTSEKIVSTLENLDMSKEARFEQDKRVAVDEEDISKKGKVIARVGKEYVYEDVLDELLSQLPPELKEMSNNPQIRQTLIQQYVMQEALLARAQRMALDKEPIVQKTLELTKKQLLVKHLMDKELAEKFKVTEPELKALYEQQKENFSEAATLGLRYSLLKDGEKISVAKKLLAKSEDEILWLDSSFTYIPEIGEAEKVIERLFKMKAGEYSDVETIDNKRYLFLIADKKEAQVMAFEDLREQLHKQYSSEKEQRITQEFISTVMEEEDVEIYPQTTKAENRQ